MDYKFIGYRIKLLPTEDQINLFTEYFGVSRAAYNLALEIENINYENYLNGKSDKSFLSFFELNSIINKIKKTDQRYSYMCNYNNETISVSIRDLVNGFNKFFNGINSRPVFKSKKFKSKSFPIRSDRLLIEKNRVRISSIGYVQTGTNQDKIIGYGNKDSKTYKHIDYSNARITFNGCDYYLCFEIKTDINDQIISYNSNYNYRYNESYKSKPYSTAIGIDLGCSGDNWIVMSDGYKKSLPDFSKETKKISMLMKKSARQRSINSANLERANSDYGEYIKSKNEIKTEREINKYYKSITNKRISAIYDACKHILDTKPEAVIMEDIKVNDMINSVKSEDIPYYSKTQYINKVLSSALYTVKDKFTYVLESNNIPVYTVDSNYPSSKICSKCGYIQNIKRKKIFKCPNCGNKLDRDINASINLSNWYYNNF